MEKIDKEEDIEEKVKTEVEIGIITETEAETEMEIGIKIEVTVETEVETGTTVEVIVEEGIIREIKVEVEIKIDIKTGMKTVESIKKHIKESTKLSIITIKTTDTIMNSRNRTRFETPNGTRYRRKSSGGTLFDRSRSKSHERKINE